MSLHGKEEAESLVHLALRLVHQAFFVAFEMVRNLMVSGVITVVELNVLILSCARILEERNSAHNENSNT